MGTWEFNISHRRLYWSDQMYEIFDQKKGAVSPTLGDVHNYIHVYDRFLWELMMNQVSIDGRPVEISIKIYGAKDRLKWILFKAEGVYEGQVLTSIRGSCEEILETEAVV